MKQRLWKATLVALILFTILGVPLFHSHAQATINPPPGNGWTQLTSGITAVTYTDTTCKSGTTCYYAVESADQFGVGLDTTYVTASPTTAAPDVVLTWTASTTTGVTYTVFQGPPPAAPAGLAAATSNTP